MLTILSRVKIKGRYIVLTLIFMLISAVGTMLLPSFLAKMIDSGVKAGDSSAIWNNAIVMAVLTVISFLANIVCVKFSAKISAEFGRDLRSEVFKKVQSFSLAEIDRFGTAGLVTRSTSDIVNIQLFITYAIQFGILSPMMFVAGLWLTSTTGAQINTVLQTSIPILLISCTFIIAFIIRVTNKLRKKVDDVNGLFLESLEGVRVIRAFNKQKHEIGRFENTNNDYAILSNRSAKISGLLVPVINIIFGLTSTAVMAFGSYFVINQEMEIGQLVASNQYIAMILLAVLLLTLVLVLIPKTLSCSKRVAEILNTEVSILDGDKETSNRPLRGTVEFKNVTFSYPKAEAPVLENISFKAMPGQFVAIIGRTGSGKSSVLKLIPRFYDTTFGEVLVDGMNVKDYKVKELRDIIGYVPQKNVLFSGDIASNLNYGKEDGVEADWKEAARIACADEFIDKKDKQYHDFIAQGGTNLSGGQRQRMAIARAVMKKPEIYLFDDSFSALDMKTDRILRSNIRENMGDSTVVMVAQRVSSIIDADKILVIENNKIVGDGTHKELLKSCDLYREIAELQLGVDVVKAEIESAN